MKPYSAIVLQQADRQSPVLVVEDDLALPAELAADQLLVKIIYAAINPSDFMVLRGTYAVEKTLPAVLGTVGVGTVAATGRSLKSRWLLGKRVACAGSYTGDGPWAQYMLASNASVLPLQRAISDETGANVLSNPNTALAIIYELKRRGVRSFIQSAAASDIGQLLQAAATEHRMHVINIVRKHEHAELLRSKFSFPVLNSTAQTFDEELKAAARTHMPAVFLDSVSGELTARVARALMPGGQIIVYGRLSGQDPAIDYTLFMQRGLRLETFSMMHWVADRSFAGMLLHALRLQSFCRRHSGARILGTVGLRQLSEEWQDYEKHSGSGKYLLDPFMDSSAAIRTA